MVTMDGPGGTVCSTMDGPVGPVIARTIYGVTVQNHCPEYNQASCEVCTPSLDW